MSESKTRLLNDANRLRAALATIHDHLHHGRVNEAHEVCECAERGEEVAPANITLDDAASLQRFMAHFNTLAKSANLRAATLVVVPSKTQAGAFSIQIGGEVSACKALEELLGKRSTFMGDHKPRIVVPH